MSGIAGVFLRAGEPVDRAELEGMAAVLAHRGRDGSGLWVEGPVGLAHRLLFTTPESFFEQQPWAQFDLCVTADARIDNREELARLLGIDLRDLPVIDDSQLIVLAYRRWGKDCPRYLLGDFAFAIWDAGRGELFCARDPLGVKPFYYSLTGEALVFGSEMKALLNSRRVHARLNEAWLAVFLLPKEITDKQSTFYEGILRLLPAHTLTVSSSGQRLDCYWQVDPTREIRYPDEAQYCEGLREKFTQAVRVRMRSAFPIGSTLSGGIDSSSIACTARNLQSSGGGPALHAYSAVFQDAPDADESPFIQAVLEQGGFIPHLLHLDRGTPFPDLEQVLRSLDEPFYGPNFFMPWSFYRAAQENGVRVLLDGTDGDTTISHGMDYLEVLAQSRRWEKFAQEAVAVTQNFDHPRYASVPAIFYSYGAPYLSSLARRGRWVPFMRDVSRISSLLGIPPRRLVINAGVKPLLPASLMRAWQQVKGRQPAGGALPAHVAPAYHRQLASAGFFRRQPPAAPLPQNGRALHAQSLNMALLPYSLEIMNRLSAAHGVEVRFPFCDRQLVEFCLALPPEVKLNGGYSRYIMRKAMTGVLPEEVQWRGGKISLVNVSPYMMRRYGKDFIESILADPPEQLSRFINIPAVRKMFARFLKDKNLQDIEWVWQTVIIAAWMKQSVFGNESRM